MLDFIDVYTFIAVAKYDSFTRATVELAILRAIASKYVRELDAMTGVTLLYRTKRTVTFRDADARYPIEAGMALDYLRVRLRKLWRWGLRVVDYVLSLP